MADYTKTVDFAAKDALPTGNPAKLARGTEVDTELNNIETAIATKFDETSDVGVATNTAEGIVELATQAEVNTGTDTGRVVTPETLRGNSSTASLPGVIELATQAEVDAGTDTGRAVTPETLTNFSGLGGGGGTSLISAVKSVATSRMNTTAVVADPDLNIALAINTYYKLEAMIRFDNAGGSTPNMDFLFAFSGVFPLDAFGHRVHDGYLEGYDSSSVAISPVPLDAEGGAIQTFVSANSSPGLLIYKAVVDVSTAGNWTFNWAQNVSNANRLTVLEGSYLMATPLA